MKNLFKKSWIAFSILAVIMFSCCKKNGYINENPSQVLQTKPIYSTLAEFRQGIAQVSNLIQQHRITAYLDTLPNGYPNVQGQKTPLSEFASVILYKLDNNQVASAVYDVFHFDGATFSLMSYLLKAYYAGDISAQTLATIAALVPLPPIPVAGFLPPVVVGPVAVADCCDLCNPELKILVTWTYKAACGNYEKETSGYAANNKLSNMSGGKIYRFDAVITGCPCPGVLTHTVTAPAGASYGTGTGKDGSVTLLPVSSGTYTVTFTYKVCDKVITKTFTLGVK